MNRKQSLSRDILPVVGLELVFSVLIQLGFLLAQKWNIPVLLGGIVGTVVATGYYLSIVLAAVLASKKAQNQDAKGGKDLLKAMYPLRMLVTFGVLLLCCISKQFNVLALLLPMLTIQPAMMIASLIQRKGKKS